MVVQARRGGTQHISKRLASSCRNGKERLGETGISVLERGKT